MIYCAVTVTTVHPLLWTCHQTRSRLLNLTAGLLSCVRLLLSCSCSSKVLTESSSLPSREGDFLSSVVCRQILTVRSTTHRVNVRRCLDDNLSLLLVACAEVENLESA